ncbi:MULTISPECIES: hypothetical protein [Sphingobacterium]|uniref:Uncharacterized protein n=1 Tax=Sphingobacterium litopenaei TaxID=2763500 RepID=A0ABR7YF37_9SPHI|nr:MULTISPECIES: hypothetical protein [Sphingobacterium]MBD1429933.1 hypothetical protein [Sphingobacterium litopenaei]NGM74361.1 hypothetical protein [Sphingobacterium sp. SGL-16]
MNQRYTQISYTAADNTVRSIRFYSFGYYISSLSTLLTSEEVESFHWINRSTLSREVYTSTTTSLNGDIIGAATDSGYPNTSMMNIRCVREIR